MIKLKLPQSLCIHKRSKNKLPHLVLFFLISFSSSNVWSQLSDTHYLPPFYSGVYTEGVWQDKDVYLSTPSKTTIMVTVTDGAGNLMGAGNALSPVAGEYELSIDSPYTLRFVTSTGVNQGAPIESTCVSAVLNRVEKGLKFVSTEDFYVNFKVKSVSLVGSLSSEGISALGTRFALGGSPNKQAYCIMNIMATEDGTIIDITDGNTELQINTNSDNTVGVIQITLNKGESYVLSENTNAETLHRKDLKGLTVVATRPIAATLVCSVFLKRNEKPKTIKTLKKCVRNYSIVI
jgi:hypothetical protein